MNLKYQQCKSMKFKCSELDFFQLSHSSLLSHLIQVFLLSPLEVFVLFGSCLKQPPLCLNFIPRCSRGPLNCLLGTILHTPRNSLSCLGPQLGYALHCLWEKSLAVSSCQLWDDHLQWSRIPGFAAPYESTGLLASHMLSWQLLACSSHALHHLWSLWWDHLCGIYLLASTWPLFSVSLGRQEFLDCFHATLAK